MFLAQTMDATLGVRIHMQHDASTSQPWHHLGIMNTSGPDRPAKCESNEFFFSKHKTHASILPGSATFRGQAAFLVGQKIPPASKCGAMDPIQARFPSPGKREQTKTAPMKTCVFCMSFFYATPIRGRSRSEQNTKLAQCFRVPLGLWGVKLSQGLVRNTRFLSF